ncbi:MAG TPA: DUF3486 family protein [Polyangiaceae bacterium]|nr:DUF3486 family protein [Polyangiaceae bacterium]
MANRKRPTSITKLPPELRAELDRLLVGGAHTLREVTDHLRSMGAGVSKSAVHRYSQDMEEVARDIKATREMANAIGRELAEVPNGDAGRLIIESLHGLLLQARRQLATGDEIELSDLAHLTRSCKDLQLAFKANVQVEMAVRDRTLREAAEAAAKVGKAQGLGDDAIQEFRDRILGIPKETA